MIRKIAKLTNFGIFQDFQWKTELPDFKKFNLIYGWNRSGKTTISRVFESCEKRCTYDNERFKQYPSIFDVNGNLEKEGEFEITADDSISVKYSDIANSNLPIKVFNQDFIEANIFFDSDSCHPIVYVSEEDNKKKKRLDQLKKESIILQKTMEQAQKDKSSKEESKSHFLTSLGREIANILFDKTYNKTKAEKKISIIGTDNITDKKLSDDDKKKYEMISRSEERKPQKLFLEFKFLFMFNNEAVDSFQKITEKIIALLKKQVVSETLNRLKDDPVLNNWVKQGFDYYRSREDKTKCLFCQKKLDDDFLTILSKHFSKDYEELQSSIARLKSEILVLKHDQIATKNDDLYPDLIDNFSTKAKKLNECIMKMNAWIEGASKVLQEKYDNPLEEIDSPMQPEEFLVPYNGVISELNKIIVEHNEKVKNHGKEVSDARDKLELHLIANAITDQDYLKMVTELEDAFKKEKEALDAFNDTKLEIKNLEEQTSEIGKALPDINNHLKEFFGREEILLILDSDEEGYVINRNGYPAKNLSEGEKTAIAFSYFIVKINEGGFDKSKGIIFIDDPISSFDSNFIYHCFSLIKANFKEIGQLFISTHNFQLFNLVKEWLIEKNNKIEMKNKKLKSEGKEENPLPCEFYMAESFINDDSRRARIVKLDKTLRRFKSEYQFLFSRLKSFLIDQGNPYEDCYIIGNIARRFFDIYADFKIPNTGDPKSKMDVLVRTINNPSEIISATNAAKAYKLVNEYSHNSDPTSTIEHKDKYECKEAVRILLEIVEKSDPEHYRILEESLA